MEVSAIKQVLERKKYIIFTKPNQLNIVGIRRFVRDLNKFDDTMIVFWYDKKYTEHSREYKITTAPGIYWLQNLLNREGTAILLEDQYVDGYKLGLHKQEYLALIQNKPVNIVRDANKDTFLDINGKVYTGYFGINIHRASKWNVVENIGKYSAGCQVVQKYDDFKELIELCKIQMDLYGNKFTYTLINDLDLRINIVLNNETAKQDNTIVYG